MSTGEYSEDEYTPSDSTLADPQSSLPPTPSFPSQPPLLHQSSSRPLLLEESSPSTTRTPPIVPTQPRRPEGDSSMDSHIRFESPRNHNNDSLFHRHVDSELTLDEENEEYEIHSYIQRGKKPIETSSLLGYDSRTYGGNSADSYKSDYDDEDPLYVQSLISLFIAISFIIGVVCVVVLSGFSHLWAQRYEEKFSIESDWKNRGEIPMKYGCNAAEPISIPLTWKNVPNMPIGASELPNSHSHNGHYSPPCHSDRFDIHAYAIDDHAKIGNKTLQSSLKIIKSFVGVPTAKLSGRYAVAHGNTDDNTLGDSEHSHGNGEHDEDLDSSQNEHASEEDDGETHENKRPSEEEHDAPHGNDHHSEEKHDKPAEQEHVSDEGHGSHAPIVSHKRSRRSWRENLRKYL